MELNYESNINLEEMPQLVLEKIISFLNHKQLLALEQVSRNLKCAVDGYFSVTNHLVIGRLPKVINLYEDYKSFEEGARNEKYFDGFLKVIKRCGPRLRTIQITITGKLRSQIFENYIEYFRYLFGSVEVADNCPNIENIITFPKVELDSQIFNQRNIVLDQSDIEVYARKIKLSTGRTCEFRTLSLDPKFPNREDQISLYSNVEQINVHTLDTFYQFLPRFIENGLKDFWIYSNISVEEVEKVLKIGRNLRSIIFTLRVERKDDVMPLNRLRLHKNVKVILEIGVDCIALLKRNICNSIFRCDTQLPFKTYTSMDRLKNLEEVRILDSDQIKVIAEGSFEKLKIIRTGVAAPLRFQILDLTFLPKLLINKGKQLTVIDIRYDCVYSLETVWRVLKDCKAAEIIKFRDAAVDSPSNLTYEDVKAVYNLPSLQHLRLSILQKPDQNCQMLFKLLREATEDTYFKFEYELDEDLFSEYSPFYEQTFTLDRKCFD